MTAIVSRGSGLMFGIRGDTSSTVSLLQTSGLSTIQPEPDKWYVRYINTAMEERMRRYILLCGLVLVALLSTLAFIFQDFIRADAWHTRNGDSVSIGSRHIAIPHNWEPAGPLNDLATPTAAGAVIVRAAIMPWNQGGSSLRFEPLPEEIESDALAHNLIQAWANGDEGRVDLAASETVTIKGRSTFYCVRRVHHNYNVELYCLAGGFEYSVISSLGDPSSEAKVKAMIASIE